MPADDEDQSSVDEQQRLRARRAADEAADPERLLPGEDPSSMQPDDARLWIDVYSELLDYKRALLEVTEQKLARMRDEPSRREVVETDEVVIGAECRRFEQRLGFWKRRLDEAESRA